MSSIVLCGVTLSTNAKTGKALNVDRRYCQPSELCAKVCYGCHVSAEMAQRLSIRANAGPITWKASQASYRRNRCRLEQMSSAQLQELAIQITQTLERCGMSNLRLCGMGELFPQLVELAAWLSHFGIRPWGFTKRPDMLQLMHHWMLRLDPMSEDAMPVLHGSVDESMERWRINQLASTSRTLEAACGRWAWPRLAYMTMNPGWVGAAEVRNMGLPGVRVVFGYHTSRHKTVVHHELACPATNGEHITCQECRRCIDGYSGER